MEPIVTVTLNPSVDGSAEAELVRHTHKIRTSNERYDPGGGGINVARVVRELGGRALALYAAGGVTGSVLDRLVALADIPHESVPIAGDTRISHVVFERASGKEYRFVPEGPVVSEAECARFLAALDRMEFAYLVVSGSLPRGAPVDLYGRIARTVTERGAHLVLDTSGHALDAALAHGGIRLVKPSLGEFEALIGHRLEGVAAIGEAAQSLIKAGQAELVAVTMGHEGAILATATRVLHKHAPPVSVRSAVGAGDSFVAGMTHGLASGLDPEDAFVLGMAAGTAAVLTPGTDLCRREDVARLRALIADTPGRSEA